MQPVPRIFVSATSRDLRTARGMVSEGLRRMECLPIVQDDFPPDYKSVRDMLRTKIETCNAVVHLAGFYYGAEPQPVLPGPDRRSFTQMEYEIAMELKLPCYVFLCGKDFPFDAHEPEEEEKQALQLAHRGRLLKRDELFYEFATPEELANRTRELQLSVEGLRSELAKERFRRRLTLAACLVLILGGGAYFYQRMQKSDAVIAETTAQLQKQGDLIAQLLAEQQRLREATGGATQDVVKQAEVNVAKANNQSVEEIQRSVQEALAESRAAVAAAGDDQVKLVAALEKLIDAEKAVGHENEAIEAMQRLQKTLDREVDSEKWATVTDRLLYALKQRSPLNDEPVEWRKEAVEWARTAPKLGEEHPATLELMRGLTSYLPTAEGIAMERVIARAQEKRLGPDAPETLKALRNLAISLGGVAEEEGDEAAADEADQLYRKILEIQTRKHGRFSVQVVNLTVNRSEFLLSLGRGKEAEKELEALISGIEGEKGKEDSLLTGLLSMMADIKEEAEDASSALALRRRIIAIEEKSGGKDSDDVLVSKANLAVGILDTGEEGLLGEAERLLREVLDARVRLIGSSQPRTWVTFQNLAVCLRRKGDLKGAIDLELRRLEEMKKALSEDDAGVISEVRIIGDELSEEDDEESQRAGVALLQEALESADQRLPPDSEEIVSLLSKVGSQLIGLDEFERAEAFLRREVELREKHHSEDSEALSLACFGMFRIMKKFKKDDEALEYASQALKYSPDDVDYQKLVRNLKSSRSEELEDLPPSMEDYAAFRKEINDKVQNGDLTITTLDLASKSGRTHYLKGAWNGDRMERVMEWDAEDDSNGTFTFYYFNQHGALMSIFRLREGVDVPIDDVKKAGDTFNFYNRKLVSWKRSQDDLEQVEEPGSEGFDEKGRKVYQAAQAVVSKIRKAGPNPN